MLNSKILKTKNHKIFVLTLLVALSCTDSSRPTENNNPVRINFTHNENQLYGWFYQATGATGAAQHSTVILLHGSVGRDGDIFNIGDNLSKEGFNVLTYNYPGSWKSEGAKLDEPALYSVQTAIKFAKSDSVVQTFSVDTTNIILMGYSYGSGMALLGSLFDQSVKKVVAIAVSDLSLVADDLANSPEARNTFEHRVDGLLADPFMAKGTTGEEYVNLLIKNKEKFALKSHSSELVEKEILLIGGWLDYEKKIEDEILPLYRKLKADGARNVKIEALETNHNFTNVQQELNEIIIDWLNEEK